MYLVNLLSMIIGGNHFCGLHRPIYQKNINWTSLEEVDDLYGGHKLKNVNFPDFSIKKSHIFSKNNTGESFFALTWSLYNVLTIPNVFISFLTQNPPMSDFWNSERLLRNLIFQIIDRNVFFSLKYSLNKSKIGM